MGHFYPLQLIFDQLHNFVRVQHAGTYQGLDFYLMETLNTLRFDIFISRWHSIQFSDTIHFIYPKMYKTLQHFNYFSFFLIPRIFLFFVVYEHCLKLLFRCHCLQKIWTTAFWYWYSKFCVLIIQPFFFLL